MSKKEVNVTDILDEVIGITNPSKEDLEKQIEQDKINYLVKELQTAVDDITKSKEASWKYQIC